MSSAAKRHRKKVARKAALKRRSPPPRVGTRATHAAPADYLSELTRQGLQLHQAGRVQEAEVIYRQVLDAKPGHADANHLLGNIALDAGHHEYAAELIAKAVSKAPKQAIFRNSLGNALQALGRLDEAAASYGRAIALQLDYADAHNNRANVLLAQGRLHEAVTGYQKALAINPGYAEAHYNLANALHAQGQAEEAIAGYDKALAIKPDYADAEGNRANVLKGLGRADEALAGYRRGIEANPAAAGIHNNLGNALEELGQPEDALECYRTAIRIDAHFAEAHSNLGNVLRSMGQAGEAVASYQTALAIRPDYAEAHNNMGNALRDLARMEEAVVCYERALAVDPDYAVAHSNLGVALHLLGHSEPALAHSRRAIALEPEIDAYWSGLVACLETAVFTAADETLYADLLALLERPTVRANSLAGAIVSALRQHPNVVDLLERGAAVDGVEPVDLTDAPARLAAIPLFLRVIEQCHINDLGIERLLTRIRHTLLKAVTAGPSDCLVVPFAVALALHCFTNEYVFSESAEESAAIEALERELAGLAKQSADISPAVLAVLASYRPLHGFAWAAGFPEREWADEVQPLIRRQIAEPGQERELRDRIDALTPIDDEVSRSVRAQYEENPYPRWVKTNIESQSRSVSAVLSGSPLHFDLGDSAFPDSPEILVAGCGTGQHALQAATQFRNAQVLAVDLSLNSLGYAARKTSELGCRNIDYAQADITKLGGLDRRFDVIECSGVLHHMRDPMEGWRVLTGLLRSGGVMQIALYSEIARQPVVEARALIAERGYGSTPDDIRRCRSDIIAAADDEASGTAGLLEFRDFYSLSECRDLIFHVQEHRFALPQIEAALDELKLEFLGFELREQGVMRAFAEAHPDPDARTALASWHEFEQANPGIFRGMYQFWCRKP